MQLTMRLASGLVVGTGLNLNRPSLAWTRTWTGLQLLALAFALCASRL